LRAAGPELRLGEEVVTPSARPALRGRGGPVVNFYNGSGGSGAEITAETAHQGLSELYAAGSASFS
jgi:hypothetical protein